MSYFRQGMGDGPVTDPCQVDPSLCPGTGIIVGTAPPTRVDCSQLPADSPFRQPGQPCAESSGGIASWFLDLVRPTFQPTATAQDQGAGGGSNLLFFGGAAVAAYYLCFRKGR